MILVAAILAGCSSTQPSASPSPVPEEVPAELLASEDWVLVGATVTPDPAPFAVTLRFADGQLSGNGPVNRYSGPVTLGQGTLSVGDIVSTKMAGPPEAMAAEQAYFSALTAATGWEAVDQNLTLVDSAQSPLLVFAGPDSPGAFAAGLIGLDTKQAKARIADEGYEVRVVSVDGKQRPATTDYRPDRINLTIDDGVVTRATSG